MLADNILKEPYETEKGSNKKTHLIEESASHFIFKKILATSPEKEKQSLLCKFI